MLPFMNMSKILHHHNSADLSISHVHPGRKKQQTDKEKRMRKKRQTIKHNEMHAKHGCWTHHPLKNQNH